MRDTLCNEDYLKKKIILNENYIRKNIEEIVVLQEDIKNGIQRYPRENSEIIYDTKLMLFQMIYSSICAKYSLGLSCDSFEEMYLLGVKMISDIGYRRIGYVHMIQFFSIGMLLEISAKEMQKLIEKADEEEQDDILFDFLVSACGWERNINSSQFQKESPYSKTLEIIKLAAENREAANIRLKKYVEKEWLEGHASYGWKTAHKKVGYAGIWSFESAALAKILALNDEKLKSNSHYPYDLAHYKSNKRFSVKAIETVEKNRRKDETGEGIVSNRELECIVPAQFQNMVNTAIMDYDKLEDEEFWNKYKLSEIWYTLEMYEDDKKKAILLGTILVNLLVDKGYIIQIDYKEDIEDYIDNIKNFWGEQEIKLVRFELENDQNYYAKVPRISNVKNMYEVHILDER